jgi:hypothetical protein
LRTMHIQLRFDYQAIMMNLRSSRRRAAKSVHAPSSCRATCPQPSEICHTHGFESKNLPEARSKDHETCSAAGRSTAHPTAPDGHDGPPPLAKGVRANGRKSGPTCADK